MRPQLMLANEAFAAVRNVIHHKPATASRAVQSALLSCCIIPQNAPAPGEGCLQRPAFCKGQAKQASPRGSDLELATILILACACGDLGNTKNRLCVNLSCMHELVRTVLSVTVQNSVLHAKVLRSTCQHHH